MLAPTPPWHAWHNQRIVMVYSIHHWTKTEMTSWLCLTKTEIRTFKCTLVKGPFHFPNMKKMRNLYFMQLLGTNCFIRKHLTRFSDHFNFKFVLITNCCRSIGYLRFNHFSFRHTSYFRSFELLLWYAAYKFSKQFVKSSCRFTRQPNGFFHRAGRAFVLEFPSSWIN